MDKRPRLDLTPFAGPVYFRAPDEEPAWMYKAENRCRSMAPDDYICVTKGCNGIAISFGATRSQAGQYLCGKCHYKSWHAVEGTSLEYFGNGKRKCDGRGIAAARPLYKRLVHKRIKAIPPLPVSAAAPVMGLDVKHQGHEETYDYKEMKSILPVSLDGKEPPLLKSCKEEARSYGGANGDGRNECITDYITVFLQKDIQPLLDKLQPPHGIEGVVPKQAFTFWTMIQGCTCADEAAEARYLEEGKFDVAFLERRKRLFRSKIVDKPKRGEGPKEIRVQGMRMFWDNVYLDEKETRAKFCSLYAKAVQPAVDAFVEEWRGRPVALLHSRPEAFLDYNDYSRLFTDIDALFVMLTTPDGPTAYPWTV